MAFGQYFTNSFPIPGGPLVSHGFSSVGSLDLAWTLFDFGRRKALVDAGEQRLIAANFAFNRKHQEIAYRVASSFFAYQAVLSKVTAAQQTMDAASASTAAVKAKFDKGLATRPDLLLAIQEQAKASYDLQDARGSVIQTQADLTTSLGISPSYSLQLIDLSKLPLPAGLVQSVEKIVDQALEQRPDLMARLAELRAREAEVKRARAEFWPKISLKGMIGNQYWGSVHTNPPGNESYSGSNMVDTAMINVEWTLFDGFERSNAVHEAEAMKEASKAQLESFRLEIMRDIWKAYADTKTTLEKREFALALLKAAEESYDATQESYNHGFSTLIELLSAQKDLARARYTEIDSRANLLRSAATLVYASGGQSRGDLSTDTDAFGRSLP
jgi:outer membrane protein TolC